MATKTSDNWKSKPGSFDIAKIDYQLYSDNEFGFPELRTSEKALNNPPATLVDYRTARDLPDNHPALKGAALSFFIDDYRFEMVWNQPNRTLPTFLRADTVLTPNFSLYIDWPLAVQIWNTYRTRWLGAFWQQQGVNVIPTLCWSDERSYAFAFQSIERGSPVAIGTLGFKYKDEYLGFRRGYDVMVEAINPAYVVWYGSMDGFDWALDDNLPRVYNYPARWALIKPTGADIRRVGGEEQAIKILKPHPGGGGLAEPDVPVTRRSPNKKEPSRIVVSQMLLPAAGRLRTLDEMKPPGYPFNPNEFTR
jgi:hypothetical protein